MLSLEEIFQFHDILPEKRCWDQFVEEHIVMDASLQVCAHIAGKLDNTRFILNCVAPQSRAPQVV